MQQNGAFPCRRSAQLIARVFRGHLALSEPQLLQQQQEQQEQQEQQQQQQQQQEQQEQQHQQEQQQQQWFTFRGYLSRRHIFDFATRAQFLKALVERMREAEALALRFAAAAESRHYLRSTQEIPGVFLPPLKPSDGGASHKRRETRLQQVMSAAAAAAKQHAEERHLQPLTLLGVDIDCLLRDPQKTVAALKPRAAARGPAAAVRELQQATHTLLRGCAASPPTRAAAATAAAATAAAAAATAGREQRERAAD
ncbi:hypothetical protein Emed_004803 [Eimeria media]